jgi:hypothetical protein
MKSIVSPEGQSALRNIVNMNNGHIYTPELLASHLDALTTLCYATHIATSCQNGGCNAEVTKELQ